MWERCRGKERGGKDYDRVEQQPKTKLRFGACVASFTTTYCRLYFPNGSIMGACGGGIMLELTLKLKTVRQGDTKLLL